ncbi:hypothetical protein JXO59_00040, partial [candidate division KSB1 bacterium]|nr:hypothetical protein [candidate division KSB1 bacterium]
GLGGDCFAPWRLLFFFMPCSFARNDILFYVIAGIKTDLPFPTRNDSLFFVLFGIMAVLPYPTRNDSL